MYLQSATPALWAPGPLVKVTKTAYAVRVKKRKEKTTPVGVIQEKLMVNPSFPLAKANAVRVNRYGLDLRCL